MTVVNKSALTNSHKNLLKVLKQIQFGFGHTRCPACAGWNMGPNGETDFAHTPKCPVFLAIEEAEEFYE